MSLGFLPVLLAFIGVIWGHCEFMLYQFGAAWDSFGLP